MPLVPNEALLWDVNQVRCFSCSFQFSFLFFLFVSLFSSFEYQW
jgi:hypothetical protein